MASIVLRLDERTEKNGMQQVRLRISHRGTNAWYPTGVLVEPEYFNAFRLTSATVKAVGKGLGTMSLVKEALAIWKTEKAKGKTFDYCWVVFDKDDYND